MAWQVQWKNSRVRKCKALERKRGEVMDQRISIRKGRNEDKQELRERERGSREICKLEVSVRK